MRNILVPVDLSDITSAVVATAADMARAVGGKLYVVHVTGPSDHAVPTEYGPAASRTDVANGLRADHRAVHEIALKLQAQGCDALALVVQGNAVEQVLREAQRLQATLIVMGSHGHGALYHLLMGSVSGGVLRKSPCPVLVVPARASSPPAKARMEASAR